MKCMNVESNYTYLKPKFQKGYFTQNDFDYPYWIAI